MGEHSAPNIDDLATFNLVYGSKGYDYNGNEWPDLDVKVWPVGTRLQDAIDKILDES